MYSLLSTEGPVTINDEVALAPPGTTNWRVLMPGAVFAATVYSAVNEVKVLLGEIVVRVTPGTESAIGQMFIPEIVIVPVAPADAADGFTDVIEGATVGQTHSEVVVGTHAVLAVFLAAVNKYFPTCVKESVGIIVEPSGLPA